MVGIAAFVTEISPTSSKMMPFCLLQNYVSFMKARNMAGGGNWAICPMPTPVECQTRHDNKVTVAHNKCNFDSYHTLI